MISAKVFEILWVWAMIINQDRIAKFVVIDGPRGAGKSLYMSSLQARLLIRYYCLSLLTGEVRRVWSNYPVAFWWNTPLGNRVYLQSEPINRDAVILFEKELGHGWVFITEMDQWLDKQDWGSNASKVIVKGMTQIRKRNLSFCGDLQDSTWLNGRASFQVDIKVGVRESAFTPWGRKQGVDLGEVSFLTFRDISGIMTGYKYEENWREYQLVFQGKRFHNIYDTNIEFDPLESRTKYKFKAPVKEIVYGGDEGSYDEEPGAIGPAGLKSPVKNPDHSLLSDLVNELIGKGNKVIGTVQFWDEASNRGLKGSKFGELGKYVTRTLGLEKVGANLGYYSLEKSAALVTD